MKSRSAAGFATPPLTLCAKLRHPIWHKTLRTGLQIPSDVGSRSLGRANGFIVGPRGTKPQPRQVVGKQKACPEFVERMLAHSSTRWLSAHSGQYVAAGQPSQIATARFLSPKVSLLSRKVSLLSPCAISVAMAQACILRILAGPWVGWSCED